MKKKESRVRLEESERFLAAILDAIQDGICVMNTELTILKVNSTLQKWYPHKLPLEGKKCYAVFRERSETCPNCPATKALQSEKLETTEATVKNPDGSYVVFETYAVPMRNAKGRITHIVEYVRDITRRKQAEAAGKRSDTLYRLLVEHAHDAIFIAQDDVLKYANPSTENILGYSKEELARIPFSDLIHPADRETVIKRYRQRLQGAKVPEYYTFRALSRHNEELWLEINAVLVEWEEKPAALCFVRDVTQNRNMELQLLQAQKMQAIGTLAGGIAHDFNNILSAIMGYSEICLSESDADSQMARRLKRVLQAGHRAKDLVDQILTFSRQEEQEQKPVQIKVIVKEAMKLLRASIPSTIQFRQQIDKDTGIVLADPTRIHQVIMNLCSNAAHSMQDTGGTLGVTLSNCTLDDAKVKQYIGLKAGPYVRLSVSDTGHGMNPETVKRIFDPYFTTKKPGEGTGLGLSSVHGIVTHLGGTIDVQSNPGHGTDFHVYLPRIVSDFDDEIISEAPYPQGNETILLVDDEEAILEMAGEMLEGLGYTVALRISSVEAYQAFKGTPDRFDLVITDLTMPHMTGIELAAKIRGINKDIPVILCTGFSEGMTADKAKSIGIQAILNKPILKRELAETIRAVLDHL